MLKLRIPICVLLAGSFIGCAPKSKPAKEKVKPARVEAHPTEKDIYRIVLTPEATRRLQIKTVAVKKQSVPQFRVVGGDITTPDGNRIPVAAPLTGTLKPAGGDLVLQPGQQVKRGQLLFQLMPILPPERAVANAPERVQMANARATLVSQQIIATGDVKQAEARVTAADIDLVRAKKLFSDKAGSRRSVDDAVAAKNIAQQALVAAQQRKTLLDKLTLDADTNEISAIPIHSPQSGTIQTVAARAGQAVNAGAALLEIVDLQKMWVRVPVYSGLVSQVDSKLPASVRALGTASTDYAANPIAAPPTANALASSVDLYYEVDNPDGRFRPGERIEIQLPLRGEAEYSVIPRAAILLDVHGTAWVYANTAENEFRRERVSVNFTTEDLAVLTKGPEVGTEIVTDGAAELFGTEFGAGK